MLKSQVGLINDFSGGQDTRTPILIMPLTSSPNMKNWHTSGMKNRLVKRGGFSKVNSSQVPSDGLDAFYPPGYQTFDHTWRDTATNTNISQGFKPKTSSTVTSIRLWLKKTGAPTGNITISIETDSGGVPSGTSVTNGDSANFDVTTLTTSYGWAKFTFATNPTLVAGTQYHIVLKSSFSISSSNYVNWGVDNYDVIYPNGSMSHYDGTTWTSETQYNACFEVYITSGAFGNVGYAMFDFSSKSQIIGVFGTSLYGMNKTSLGTPNGSWAPLNIGTAFDSYTVLMLHMDGSDESTTITDSSTVNPKTVTAHGTCDLDTANPKFGTASCQFDGSTGYLSIPDSADWAFGANDFTIDLWMYAVAISGAANQNAMLYYNRPNNDNNNRMYFYLSSTTAGNFAVVSGGVTLASYSFTFPAISLSAWVHLALVRYGTNIYLFVNGVAATNTVNTAIGTNSIPDFGGTLVIGNENTGTNYFNGAMDEYRISNGIARWTSNFTVPSAAYSGISGALTSSRFLTFSDWQSGTALINTDIGLYSFSGVSGASVSVVSAAPLCKFIVVWQNYCFAIAPRGQNNGYQFSAVNDYTTWPAANQFFTAFNTNDGDVVTGVRILKGKMYVFKRYSIFRVTYLGSNPTFQIDLVLGTGCPSHYTIKEIDLGGTIGTVLLFLTTDKKLAIFDGYNVQIIYELGTEKSNDLFSDSDTPIAFSDMNYTYTDLFHAVAKTDTSEYILYCVLNSDTTVKYAFVYDWKTGGIYPYDNQVFASSLFAISTSKLEILYTSGQSGYMYQMESGNSDDGSAINAYWVSGKIRPQSAGLLTKLLQLFLYVKQISSGVGLTMNFQYRCDWNVTWNSVQTFNYDRNDSFAFGSTIDLDIGTIENMFQIKIQDNSTQLAGTIYGCDLFGTALGTEIEDRQTS
jgi:hypothetical protein